MKLNNYVVRVPQGQELDNGQVIMSHGQQYVISLENNNQTQCNAYVTVDDKKIGIFRLRGHRTLDLEHPSDDNGRFTFFELGSAEAIAAELGGINPDKLGLIEVTFVPEKVIRRSLISKDLRSPIEHNTRDFCFSNRAGGQSLSAGGTGLTGNSDQLFITVPPLNEDTDNATTIYLRLVSGKSVRPLKAKPMATEIPPVARG